MTRRAWSSTRCPPAVDFAKAIAGWRTAGFILGNDTGGPPAEREQGFAIAGSANPGEFVPATEGEFLESPLKGARGGGARQRIAQRRARQRRHHPAGSRCLVALKTELYPTALVEALRLAAKPNNIAIKTSGASGELSFGRRPASWRSRPASSSSRPRPTARSTCTTRRASRSATSRRQGRPRGSLIPRRRLEGLDRLGRDERAGLRDLRADRRSSRRGRRRSRCRRPEQALLGVRPRPAGFRPRRGVRLRRRLRTACRLLLASRQRLSVGLLAIGVIGVAFGFSWWASKPIAGWSIRPARRSSPSPPS